MTHALPSTHWRWVRRATACVALGLFASSPCWAQLEKSSLPEGWRPASQYPGFSKEDAEAVHAALLQFQRLVTQGDASKVAAMFTGDGALMRAGKPNAKGRTQLEAALKDMMGAGVETYSLSPKHTSTTPGQCLQEGTLEQTVRLAGGQQRVSRGVFRTHWVKQSSGMNAGNWLLSLLDVAASEEATPPVTDAASAAAR